METKSKTRTEQILKVMLVLSWIAFIACMVEAGAILFSYIVTCINPEGAKNLYKGLDLYSLRQFDFWHYSAVAFFMCIMTVMKSLVCLLLIKALAKIKITNPFSMEVAAMIEKMSYLLFGTWVLAVLDYAHREWLLQITGELYGNEVTGDTLFIAGLVFVISQIYKRGVEIQSENDLTV